MGISVNILSVNERHPTRLPTQYTTFLLIAEVIANTLRSCENVKGIKVNKTEV